MSENDETRVTRNGWRRKIFPMALAAAMAAGCGGGGTPPPPPPAPDFTISASPADITLQAGGTSTPVRITVTGINGFSGAVNVSFAGWPSGTTSSPAVPFTIAAGTSQNVTLNIPASAAAGIATITVQGSSGGLAHSATLNLTVTAAKDFSLSISPAQVAAMIGGVSPAFTVSVSGENGFTDAVTFSISGLPAGATTQPASPFTVATGASQDVTVSVPAASAVGIFNLQVNGTSGFPSHNSQVALTVLPIIKTYDTGTMAVPGDRYCDGNHKSRAEEGLGGTPSLRSV